MDWLLSFLLLFSLSHVLQAYDISSALPPRGRLGVTLDYSLATTWPTGSDAKSNTVPRNWLFSTHLTFNDPVSEITDGQLWQIATDAYNEMVQDMTQYSLGKKHRPSAMGVLAFGNELIIVSSQKGKTSFTYDLLQTSPVKDTLLLCQAVWTEFGETDSKHRNDGSCAEPMAAHLYYFSQVTPLKYQNARVATVVFDGATQQPLPRDPCGDETKPVNERPLEWGCNLFVVAENMTPVDTSIALEPYNLETLAGGLTVRDQIQLCSAHRRT